MRFRKDYLIRCGDNAKARADLVFTKLRIAVFMDGCFWHGCPVHQQVPKRNSEYWVPKLRTNAERDTRVNAALEHAGWLVLRFWEHEEVEQCADRLSVVVAERRVALASGTHEAPRAAPDGDGRR
jgi:DNA mismatch endonuclease (patch repair protein)